MSSKPVELTIWNEFRHEQSSEVVKGIYPQGIHTAIGQGVKQNLGDAVNIRYATLDQPEHGLTDEVLNSTDVLAWWGHCAHGEVSDAIVEKVHKRVLEGMGLIVLHSGHYAKIFKKLMGTDCGLRWREAAEKEIIWVIDPSHPITDGIGDRIELPEVEMYGEQFKIPEPDELIFISWFEGGEVFRSGCTWKRGKGRIFYFRPGHETFPIYHNEQVIRVISNAVKWANTSSSAPFLKGAPNSKDPIMPIQSNHVVDESLHKH